MTSIRIPEDLWEEEIEGVVSAWLYGDGEQVSAGSVVAEVMVEKVQHELTAPTDGVLKILKAAEEPVKKGDLVAHVE
ncbi:MAG: lipoyl domain-containing protein [Pseudomonadota bacterium]